MTRRWLAFAALLAGCLACNLTGQPRATPTVTLMFEPPGPEVTRLVLPTATPGPTATPLGGQFAPLATLEPTPTQIPLPTVVRPSETPQTTTPTPGPSAGPLVIASIEFTNRRQLDAQGQIAWTVTVRAAGGNGDYTYLHEDQVQTGPVFSVIGTEGAALVHTVTVRSSDGQQVSCRYYIAPNVRDYHREVCAE